MGLFDIFRKKKTEENSEKSKDSVESLSNQDNSAVLEMPEEIQEPEVEQNLDKTEESVPDHVSESVAIQEPQISVEPEAIEQQIYTKGLEKSRTGFAARFNKFLANFRSVDEDFFEDLEETLVGADVGFDMAIKIPDDLREEVKLENAHRPEDVRDVIIKKMVDMYEADGVNEDATMHFNVNGTTVILLVGVNGVGKTTTIGKLSTKYQQQGKSVLLAAADTFRAGATKQLQEWGIRAGVPVVAGKEKADPASVVFEAVAKARDEHYDILFVDTAGRLQNNVNLMQELEKMKRIIKREIPGAPHEVLLVLDATT
ncbi:MAG: signal recognition particle-docking protein FtsY, partial [Leuconostoc gelidum]